MRYLIAVCLCVGVVRADDLATTITKIDVNVLSAEQAKDAGRMLSRDVSARIQAANRRESAEWAKIRTAADWQAYVQPRIARLRESMGAFPDAPKEVKSKRRILFEGDKYRILALVYESRPGFWVTANLYEPKEPHPERIAFLICHSHHNPKTEGELQDMGVMWAMRGCPVLVIDQLGHGERRTHPFTSAESFAGSFRVGRQDYYFRYNTGLQLAAAGESLIGWMAWDMMRGIDVLAADGAKQFVLLGAVAGGGDPAAVTAALDPRVTVAVPFNFGGPQPESTYPLPADAADTFNYAGGGSWESTRNLRNSARDGFLPWVIVGSLAPRGLIYGHEFSWDQERDPVWARFSKLWPLVGGDRLAFAHGRGRLSGRPPEATHCNNIGPEHRSLIHSTLKKWFDIPVPNPEPRERRPSSELQCWTGEWREALRPKLLNTAIIEHLQDRASPPKSLVELRQSLDKTLGGTAPSAEAKIEWRSEEKLGTVSVKRGILRVERDIIVPFVLFNPKPNDKPPLMFAIAQEGKARFVRERGTAIMTLLEKGVAVCVPDLRGCGETRAGDGRGRSSSATSISSSEQMLGGTMIGARLRDLRTLRSQLAGSFDGQRIGIWGESFAPVNAAERDIAAPLDAEKSPDLGEPLGCLIALYAAVFDDVKALTIRGGLDRYTGVLATPYLYVPHDAIIPGILRIADLPDVARKLPGTMIRLERMITAVNQPAPFAPTKARYPNADHAETLSDDVTIAKWFAERLK